MPLAMLLTLGGCGGGSGGTPAPASGDFSVGGTVSGLSAGEPLQLTINGQDMLTVGSDGVFSFNTRVPRDGAYAVYISRQPVGKTCTVSGGSGSGVVADVKDVKVRCSALAFAVGGSLAGLEPGKTVRLLANGTDPLTLDHNGPFSFNARIPYNVGLEVTVDVPPSGQVCAPGAVGGLVAAVTADVTSLAIVCSATGFKVTGSLTGLDSGAQVTLRNNGTDPFPLKDNGVFSFPGLVPPGGRYWVTVATQPIDQTCQVANGSGSITTADAAGIVVSCSTPEYSIGGTVTGLDPGKTVVLDNSVGDTLSLSANGSFKFPRRLLKGTPYEIIVNPQPTDQVCTAVQDGDSDGVTADVSSISISCVPVSFRIGGSVSGLGAEKMLWLANGSKVHEVIANGRFWFPSKVRKGGTYSVTVADQPVGQTCTVSKGSGTANADVSDIDVECLWTQ